MGPAVDDPQDADFAACFARVAPALTAWVAARLAGPLARELSPEDVVQEVACRAFARRAAFDPALGPFRAWLFGIARNVLLGGLERLAAGGARVREDWLSTSGLHKVPDDATSVTQALLRSEHLARFLAVVAGLDDADRALVVHRGLEGLPHDDVAALLGIEPRAATKRWERLRERLRTTWSALDLEA